MALGILELGLQQGWKSVPIIQVPRYILIEGSWLGIETLIDQGLFILSSARRAIL
jgi:hypothetical protein